MTPFLAIDRLLLVPHTYGAGDWTGADCWGLVELWYRHVLGIELADRAEMPAVNDSVQHWADIHAGWRPIPAPVDHSVVLMSQGRLRAGHVGIFYGGSVLHTTAAHGCVYQPITDRLIRAKSTGYLVRE